MPPDAAADEAWILDVKLRRHAAQAAELWSFVCSEAGDNPDRRDKLMLQLPPARPG